MLGHFRLDLKATTHEQTSDRCRFNRKWSCTTGGFVCLGKPVSQDFRDIFLRLLSTKERIFVKRIKLHTRFTNSSFEIKTSFSSTNGSCEKKRRRVSSTIPIKPADTHRIVSPGETVRTNKRLTKPWSRYAELTDGFSADAPAHAPFTSLSRFLERQILSL